MDREKIIEDIEDGVLIARTTRTRLVHLDVDKAEEIVELLKERDAFEQKQIFVKEGHSKIVQIICPCCGKKIGCDISVDTEGR